MEKLQDLTVLGFNFIKHVIATVVLQMSRCSVENMVFHDFLYDANICLLLKKDRDETDSSSYRPLGLPNNDQKITAKVLADRLKKTLVHSYTLIRWIFVHDRYSVSNVRQIFSFKCQMPAKCNVHSQNTLLCSCFIGCSASF